MSQGSEKTGVLSNILWRFAERCGAQSVSFVVTVILARLLMPEEYGVVALITVITSILATFVESGFKSALIQKKDADELDFSTVFYFNITMGIVLYAVMFICAPAIAAFYERPYMVPYIRVLSLTLVLGGVNGVQQAVVAKRMQFKRFFYATLGGTLVSAAVGITLAYKGFGVWALIAQNLTNQAIDTAILWMTVRWRPLPAFSAKRLKPLFHYGSKLLASSLLNSATENLTSLIIGKIYSAEQLSYYDKGQKVPSMAVYNLGTAVQSVLFPAISEHQEQKETVRKMLRRSVRICSYIMFPVMMGLAVCAEPLIRILYTEKWIAMVPFMQIMCATFAFYLLHTANLQVIKALGHSGIFLKLEIIKQVVSLTVVLIAVQFDIIVLVISMIPLTVFSYAVNAFPNGSLVGYGVRAQIRDIIPPAVLTAFMGLCVYAVGLLTQIDALKLILQIPTGVLVYAAGSILFKFESFYYIKDLIKEILKKRK